MKAIFASLFMCIAINVWARSSTVISSASSGEDTLREALSLAGDGDTITIRVSSGRIALSNQLEIAEGCFPKHGILIKGNGVVLDGCNMCRILYVGAKNKITVVDADFENGHGPDCGQGGAIYNLGDLSIENAIIKNNGIYKGYALWDEYRLGSGGAIYNAGNFLIDSGSFRNNKTSNSGGVIFNEGGELVLINVDFHGNYGLENGYGKGCSGGSKGRYGIYSQGGSVKMDGAKFKEELIGSESIAPSAFSLNEMNSVSFFNCDFSNNCKSNNYQMFYVCATNFVMSNCVVSNNVGRGDQREGSILDCHFKNGIVSNVVYYGNQGQFHCLAFGGGNSVILDSQFFNNEGSLALELGGDNIEVNRCYFGGNVTEGGAIGCGIYYYGLGCETSSNVIIRNSSFYDNQSSAGFGYVGSGRPSPFGSGAITGSKAINSLVSNCVFVSNSCCNKGGAGAVEGIPYVENCVFSNNVSCYGGAVTINCNHSYLSNCVFVGNSATNEYGYGGAVFVSNDSSLSRAFIEDCSFVSNRAVSGGAIRCIGQSIISGCSFLENQADNGGAINGVNGRVVKICNSVFSRNKASTYGSVLCSYRTSSGSSAYCLFLIANSTFVENDNDYLIYGSGILLNSLSIANGKYDYYVPKHRNADFMPSIWFSVCEGRLESAYSSYWSDSSVPSRYGVLSEPNMNRDVVCASDSVPQLFRNDNCGVERVYYMPNPTGNIPAHGAFVWHDEEWDNVAYSMSKGSRKYALIGVASNATICVDRDYLGQEIKYPACPGAVYCPATSVIKHRISFETLGGPEVASVDIENGMEVGQLPTPVREGYWLYGWYADSDFTEAVNQETQIIEDRIFYARWIPNIQPDGGPYPQIVNEIEWTYFVSNGLSSIRSGKSVSAITNAIIGTVTIPSTLGGHTVCEIGDCAFRNCNKITAIYIPNCVTAIGEYAFRDCTELLNITIPDGVAEIACGAFLGCNKLKNVKLPESVVQIGSSAFYGCSKLRNMIIPANISSIGKSAFSYCSILYEVMFYGHLPEGIADSFLLSYATAVYYPEEYADEYCSIVSEEVFAGYMHESEMFNGSCKEILGSYTWHFDVKDGDATIVQTNQWGEFVRAVEPEVSGDLVINDTFGGCPVVAIGDSAFSFCTELESVVVPNGVATIDDNAFCGCEMLGQVEFPSSLQSIGKYAFSNSAVMDVVIPDGVNCIGDYAFSGCEYLGSVSVAKSVQSIGEGSFYGCTTLAQIEVDDENPVFCYIDGMLCDKVRKEVVCGVMDCAFTIPSGMLNIRSGAFAANDFLEEIEIPSSVTNIGVWAFRNCDCLTTIRFSGELPAGMDNSGLLDCATEVYYPQKYAAQYEAIVPAEIFAGYTDEEEVKPDGSYSETIDGYTWHYNVKDGEATLAWTNQWGDVTYAVCPSPTANMVIPSALGGCPVVGIDDFAFQNGYRTIKGAVTIPDSVETIGNYAFYVCTITNLSIGASLRVFDPSAFYHTRVSGIELSPNNTNLVLRDGVLYSSDLSKLLLVDKDVMTLTIPAEMESDIYGWAFRDCPFIETITVEDGNIRYEVRNGMLYDTYNDSVVCAPRRSGAVTCNIPDDTRIIRAYAIEGANYQTVEFPEGLVAIEDNAFCGCYGITEISIPTSVEYIGYEAFYGTGWWNARIEAAEASSNTTPIICDGWLLGCWYGDDFDGTIVVPDGVKALADDAFDNSDLTEVVLPVGLDIITDYAFDCCDSLKAIRFNGDKPSHVGVSYWCGELSQYYDFLCQTDLAAVCYVRKDVSGWTDDAGHLPEYWPINPEDPDYTYDARKLSYWATSLPTLTIARDVGGGNCRVTLRSETEGAIIRYTVDGSEPNEMSSVYSDEIAITADTTIKAYATSDDFTDSEVVTWEISAQSELPLYWSAATNDDAHPWFETCQASSCAMQSGKIGQYGVSSFEIATNGALEISFSWMASSEEGCDNLVFYVDDEEVATISGECEWKEFLYSVEENGEHILRWSYEKDVSVNNGDDCGRLKDMVITVTEPYDPIPDLGDEPTEKEVCAALDGSADEKLTECITNAANYNAYREWATNVKTSDGSGKAGAQAVKESSNAWFSFAVGSDRLISELPTSEDIKVDEFIPSSESGKFEFAVSIDGVTVGEEALKENLKQVFGLEGSTSLDPNGFSSGNVDIDFDAPENGKVKFTAGPKSGNANTGTFFMKVKVNP